MPTPTGLPKPGEIWTLTVALPPDWTPHVTTFKVLERGRGAYWSMRVSIIDHDGEPPNEFHRSPKLWVDCAYQMSRGQLKYIR
jgi:hypothetical protein